MTEQRRTEVNNLLKDTARKLLMPYTAERHAKLYSVDMRTFFHCIKCKASDHRNNMLIVKRQGRRKDRIKYFYEIAYCSECAKTYKSHKQRVGCQTY